MSVDAGFVQYLEDSLNAAAENAYVEGQPATDPVLLTPSRNYSIVQNFQKHYWTSGRTLAVRHAGMTSAIAYQEVKAMREIKNDMELALHRGTATTGNTATAPKFRGLLNTIDSSTFTSSSGTTLTEFVFNNIVTACFANPVNLREVYVNMKGKRSINQFTTSVTRYLPAGDRKTFDIIDVYESEQGVMALFKSRYQLDSSSLTTQGVSFCAIDPDYWQVGWLRPIVSQQLGLDGDRERRMLVGECTLIARSTKAGAGATGLVPYVR